jgi:hypothetical protein
MEPDGILNACTTNALMSSARTTAIIIASVYSLLFDFRTVFFLAKIPFFLSFL